MRNFLDIPFQKKAVSENGLFSGYASVFNVVDQVKEVVAPGAFTESLRERLPSLLWQHQSSEPIGVYTALREDDVGLYVEGKLALGTVRGKEAYELLNMGAITGLSIGFIPREDVVNKSTGIRTLKRVDLREISLVTFPCNEEARISSVKNLDEMATVAEIERHLRDFGGFSRSQAATIVSKIKTAPVHADYELERLAEMIEARSKVFMSNQMLNR